MTVTILRTTVLLIVCGAANGQRTGAPDGLRTPDNLYEIGKVAAWSHIGSPPRKDSAFARAEEWSREALLFDSTYRIVKQSWTGQAAENPEELSLKVDEYESAVRRIAEPGGYGNIILVDSLRRLSLALTARYLVAHPSGFAIVQDILSRDRVRLLDFPALPGMIKEELGLAAPLGGWHLAQSREQVDLIFHADGSSLNNESGRSLVHLVDPSTMIAKRDISGLLERLIEDDMLDHAVLPALAEYLRRGGTLDRGPSFDHAMADQKEKLRFPPTGATVGPANIGAMIRVFQKWDGKVMPLSTVLGR